MQVCHKGKKPVTYTNYIISPLAVFGYDFLAFPKNFQIITNIIPPHPHDLLISTKPRALPLGIPASFSLKNLQAILNGGFIFQPRQQLLIPDGCCSGGTAAAAFVFLPHHRQIFFEGKVI